jgi:hypothetical protein
MLRRYKIACLSSEAALRAIANGLRERRRLSIS